MRRMQHPERRVMKSGQDQFKGIVRLKKLARKQISGGDNGATQMDMELKTCPRPSEQMTTYKANSDDGDGEANDAELLIWDKLQRNNTGEMSDELMQVASSEDVTRDIDEVSGKPVGNGRNHHVELILQNDETVSQVKHTGPARKGDEKGKGQEAVPDEHGLTPPLGHEAIDSATDAVCAHDATLAGEPNEATDPVDVQYVTFAVDGAGAHKFQGGSVNGDPTMIVFCA